MQLVPRPQRNNNGSNGINGNQGGKAFEEDYPLNSVQLEPVRSAPQASFPPLYQYPNERVVVFIDGSNLFYAAHHLSIEIDYFRLLHYLVKGRNLVRAYFYTGVDRTNEKQQGFLLWMSRHGYRIVSKDLAQMPDGSRKANLDVEIAIDMVSLAGTYDTAVLVSGDGDLAYAVNAIAYKGARVEVVSLQSMTSDSLLNVADCYVDLTSIQSEICKHTIGKPD
jgi:uncharacterized LabA/DUF88 family protein